MVMCCPEVTIIKQNGQVVAEFSTDRFHILQNMDIVQFKFCDVFEVPLFCETLTIMPGHEERESSRNVRAEITEPGCKMEKGTRYTQRATS
jgi:hypothetical protein